MFFIPIAFVDPVFLDCFIPRESIRVIDFCFLFDNRNPLLSNPRWDGKFISWSLMSRSQCPTLFVTFNISYSHFKRLVIDLIIKKKSAADQSLKNLKKYFFQSFSTSGFIFGISLICCPFQSKVVLLNGILTVLHSSVTSNVVMQEPLKIIIQI